MMKTTTRFLLAALIASSIPAIVWLGACTVEWNGEDLDTLQQTSMAQSCSATHIQAAVNAAAPGDTVAIPAGTCYFAASDQVQLKPGISIVGAGRDRTILRRSAASTAPMFRVDCKGGSVRFSKMTLEGLGNETTGDRGLKLDDCLDFRVTDAEFRKFGHAGLTVQGNCRGVIDHCRFIDNYKLHYGYGVEVYGDGTWPALELGSRNAVFVEDSYFKGNRHCIASNNGSRYVFRHNQIFDNREDSSAVDAHGLSSWPRGSRSYEVYNNTIQNSIRRFAGIGPRGGDGVIFNNVMSGTSSPIRLMSDNKCGSYPCLDQIRSLHIWNNICTSNCTSNPVVTVAPDAASYVQENRDYWLFQRPGYNQYPYPHPLNRDDSASCGNGVVENGEECDGGACCDSDCRLRPSTHVCRVASGECDVAETCTGQTATCPADAWKSDGTRCSMGRCESGQCIAGTQLVNSSSHIANSGNFASDHPVSNLWDGCLDGTPTCTSGKSGVSSFWVEFDFGSLHDLTLARLYGDADGSWVSRSWSLKIKHSLSDQWVSVFEHQDALFNGWSVRELATSARYVRVDVYGGASTQARELEIYGRPLSPGGNLRNVALHKPVTSSTGNYPNGSPTMLTDGVFDSAQYVQVGGSGAQWMQVDLQAVYKLERINLRHYYADGRIYNDVIVQLSMNGTSWTTIFNNDADNSAGQGTGTDCTYAETAAGKDIALTAPVDARYIRTWVNGNSVNPWHHWVELEAYGNSINMALGKTGITASASYPNGTPSMLTDGVTTSSKYVQVGGSGPHWIMLDLVTPSKIGRINLRHYYADGRIYNDVIVQLSMNGTSWTTIFNNDADNSAGQGTGTDGTYAETAAGKDIVLTAPMDARYIRTWTNGSNVNPWNHWVEMEVYGP
jgi:hypothetical protein